MKKTFLLTILIFSSTILLPQKYMAGKNGENESALKTLPTLWQQTGAEYRALCYQAFNQATLRVDALSKSKIRKQKMAIVTDLDETILDNSMQTAQLIKEGKDYSKALWKEWSDLAMATPIPGAVEFLNHARDRGISVYYISNRKNDEIDATIANLKKLGIPYADREHMLFREKEKSKEKRRQAVMKDHTVVMLMGDNLNDFLSCFEDTAYVVRNGYADQYKDEWGKKFIVIPNSTYGEWEDALYRDLNQQTMQARDSVRMTTLKGYK